MDRKGGNKEKMRKWIEWISPFPHSLSISSSFSHSLSIFSQPGCQAAASCATLVPFAKSQENCLQGTQTKPISKVGQGLIRLKSGRNPVWKGAPGIQFTLFLMLGGSGFLCERNFEMTNKPQDTLWQIRGAHTDDPVWEGGINVHICIYHPSAHPLSSQRNTCILSVILIWFLRWRQFAGQKIEVGTKKLIYIKRRREQTFLTSRF